MSLHLRNPMPFHARNNPSFSFLFPLSLSRLTQPESSRTLTLASTMPSEPSSSSKRPTCTSCSKPARFCLCSRIKNPKLNNSVSISILQHALEQKHPLNSARIAALGLKNLNVFPVSDVNFEAHFTIRARESDPVIDFDPSEERNNGSNESSDFSQVPNVEDERSLITFKIGKYGVTSPNFDHLLTCPIVFDALSKGFDVKKWQSKLLNGSSYHLGLQEFEIAVAPGSALLFPSERSVGIEAIDFEVKNLIVLDGTWAKAKRMYNENPWLRFLPHLRLDLEKMSLYSEVRHQPRAGFLSTIESIVYAMKGLGDESDELDHLLEVFESMVGDQRRCKDERLSKVSMP